MAQFTKDDIDKIHNAVGFVVVQWSFVESNAAVLSNTLFLRSSVAKKPTQQMPKFIGQQFKFQKRCLCDCGELEPLRKDGLAIIKALEPFNRAREFFVHSVVVGVNEGVYTFHKLDAQHDEHVATVWEFDLNTFPASQRTWSPLVQAYSQLAIAIAKIYDKI